MAHQFGMHGPRMPAVAARGRTEDRCALLPERNLRGISGDWNLKYPTRPKKGVHGNYDMNAQLHWVLTIVHGIVILGAVFLTSWIAALALGRECNTDGCKPLVYITTTFHSSNKIGSSVGWAVATERPTVSEVAQYPLDKDSYAFSHFFECMHTAQMADKVCGGLGSVSAYTTCLKNDTSSNGGKAALTSCDALSTAFSQPWPTAEEYLECLFKFPVMKNTVSPRASRNVFRSCVSKTMWPFFEVQQSIDSPLFLGSYNWLILLSVGLLCMTSFGVYTASPYEHGKVRYGEPEYHMRLGLMWITISLVWLFIFLVVFFVVAVRDSSVFDNNDGIPTTNSTSVITLFFLGSCFFYFLGEALEAAVSRKFAVHVFHAARNGWGGGTGKSLKGKPGKAVDEIYHHGHVVFQPRNKRGIGSRLGFAMPKPAMAEYDIKDVQVADYYTPPLIPSWADGYIADPLIFLGFAGATGHITTDQAWNLFFSVFFYRLINMQIARYMYQCFMNNLAFTDSVNQQYHEIQTLPGQYWKTVAGGGGESAGGAVADPGDDSANNFQEDFQPDDGEESTDAPSEAGQATVDVPREPKKPHLKIQVMALSAQIANIFLFSAICFIVFNKEAPMSEVMVFNMFVVFGLIIPESLRILSHLVCQIWHPKPNGVPWRLLNVHMFIWTWDVAVRVIFACFVVLNLSAPAGSRRFLFEKSTMLLDTYMPLLSSQ